MLGTHWRVFSLQKRRAAGRTISWLERGSKKATLFSPARPSSRPSWLRLRAFRDSGQMIRRHAQGTREEAMSEKGQIRPMSLIKPLGLASAVWLLAGGMAAQAQGSVVVYCGVNEDWCRAASSAFERETG